MEFYLENNLNIKKIITKKNIFSLYGENKSGKTKFLNDVELKLKANKLIISNLDFANYNEIIFIEENFNLKKELDLQKTSNLRKSLIKEVFDFIEENDFDTLEILTNLEKTKKLFEHLNNKFFIENKNYKLVSEISFTNNIDLIEKLIKMKIVDNQNQEINDSILSRTEKFEIFINIFASISSKNKVFIFDNPDIGLDYNNLIKLVEFIKKVSINNIVFLTYTNLSFFKLLGSFDEDFYYLKNNQINKLLINSDMYLCNYIYENKLDKNIKSESELKIMIEEYKLLIEEDEDLYILRKNTFENSFLGLFDKFYLIDKTENLVKLFNKKEEFILIFLLICKQNNFVVN